MNITWNFFFLILKTLPETLRLLSPTGNHYLTRAQVKTVHKILFLPTLEKPLKHFPQSVLCHCTHYAEHHTHKAGKVNATL